MTKNAFAVLRVMLLAFTSRPYDGLVGRAYRLQPLSPATARPLTFSVVSFILQGTSFLGDETVTVRTVPYLIAINAGAVPLGPSASYTAKGETFPYRVTSRLPNFTFFSPQRHFSLLREKNRWLFRTHLPDTVPCFYKTVSEKY